MDIVAGGGGGGNLEIHLHAWCWWWSLIGTLLDGAGDGGDSKHPGGKAATDALANKHWWWWRWSDDPGNR